MALALAAPAPARAVASEWARNPQSQVRLVSAERVAARQGELRLGLQFRLAPGWHVYWKNSGDAGFAPIVTVAAAGLSGGELLWPAPHRFELPGGLEAFGYAGEVVYPVRATLSSGAPGPLRVTADVDYLTCRIDCVPYRYQLTLVQPLGDQARPDAATAPLLDRWWNELPLTPEQLPGVRTEGRLDESRAGAPVLEIEVRGMAAAAAGKPDLFLEPNDQFSTGRPVLRQTAGGLVFRLPVTPKVAGRPLPARTILAWTVTGLARAGAPVAVEARREVAVAAATTTAVAAAPTAAPAVPIPAGERQSAQPAGPSPGATVPFGLGPVVAALLATQAVAAALLAWGVLAGRRDRRGALPAALGFAALAAALLPLYALARQVRAEGLAGIELLLLAMAAFAWLRRHSGARRGLRFALTLGVVACAAAPLWLADHSRLAPTTTRGDSHAQHPHP